MNTFNPTVIRHKTFTDGLDDYAAMVISNGMTGDIYFQIYKEYSEGQTSLFYTMPYGTEFATIDAFNNWEIEGGKV